MNSKMDTGDAIYTGDVTGSINGGIAYGLLFYFFILFIIFTLCYTSYICNRSMSSPPTTTNGDHHFTGLTQGLGDDILATFPTIVYSQTMMPKLDPDHRTVNYSSGCSICLADYKPPDILRSLPECGHLFHVSCIDTWLKVHPTCPVCRNSLDFTC